MGSAVCDDTLKLLANRNCSVLDPIPGNYCPLRVCWLYETSLSSLPNPWKYCPLSICWLYETSLGSHIQQRLLCLLCEVGSIIIIGSEFVVILLCVLVSSYFIRFRSLGAIPYDYSIRENVGFAGRLSLYDDLRSYVTKCPCYILQHQSSCDQALSAHA